MQGKIDLHLHTNFSDGDLSPEQVVSEAKNKGYSAISICDHDCVDGIERAIKAGLEHGVKVIPGVEITAELEEKEIHILGYFIDYKNEALKNAISAISKSRVKRIYGMIEKLKKFDININPEDVFKLSEIGSIGRPHLATALVNGGFVKSTEEAFRKYLADKAPCYVSKFSTSPAEAIKIILNANGIPVLAHPKVLGKDEFIPEFVKAGLRGIEAYHTDHTRPTADHYESLAKANGLIVTGGSDYHGAIKKNVTIGSFTIPQRFLDELEKEAGKKRKQ